MNTPVFCRLATRQLSKALVLDSVSLELWLLCHGVRRVLHGV